MLMSSSIYTADFLVLTHHVATFSFCNLAVPHRRTHLLIYFLLTCCKVDTVFSIGFGGVLDKTVTALAILTLTLIITLAITLIITLIITLTLTLALALALLLALTPSLIRSMP